MTRAGDVPVQNRFFGEQSNLPTSPMVIVSSTEPPRTT